MNIIRFYENGLKEASRRPVLAVLLWVANFVLAAPAGLLLANVLGSALGRSAAPFDQEAAIEILTGSAGSLRAVLAAAVIGIVLYAFASVFLFGGILHTLLARGGGERPAQDFFAGGARYYGRFFRLTVYSAVLWIPALALFGALQTLISTLMADSTNERLDVALVVLRAAVALFLFYFIKMILDYARIRIVREDTNRVYDSLAWAVRFVFRRPGGTLLLYGLLGLTGLAMFGAYFGLHRLLAGETTAAIVSGFLLTQIFIAARGWLKVAFQAAELALSSWV